MAISWLNLKGETQVLSESATRIYNQLAPTYFKEDENLPLPYGAILVAAFCKMLDATAETVQPSGTKPGLAILMSPAEVDEKWLAWLAQFVGVPKKKLETAPSVAVQREWIEHPIGFRRGEEKAIRLVAEATLTGTKTMYFYPRYNSEAFSIYVGTLESQTPNPKATQEAIESIMPAWIVLTYVGTLKGGTMAILEASHALMSEIEATHPTMKDLETFPEK
jgi:hypothetical protein